jgi:ubiquinone/menaquinone biosynthesis C-methylase UbiE
MATNKNQDSLKNIISYYKRFNEKDRLLSPQGQLEFIRSKEIVRRYLPNPPAVVIDVGGATGRYSCWLAKEGYEVHLVDPVPALIEEAKRASHQQPDSPLKSIRIGDARKLDFPNLGQYWNSSAFKECMLNFLRQIEHEPSLLGVSPHLMCIARRP